MRRPTLFPAPGAVETLPESVLREARRLLAELILAVIKEAMARPTSDEGDNHE